MPDFRLCRYDGSQPGVSELDGPNLPSSSNAFANAARSWRIVYLVLRSDWTGAGHIRLAHRRERRGYRLECTDRSPFSNFENRRAASWIVVLAGVQFGLASNFQPVGHFDIARIAQSFSAKSGSDLFRTAHDFFATHRYSARYPFRLIAD